MHPFSSLKTHSGQFEDTFWKEYFVSDDRVVPHHRFERVIDHFLRGDSSKKTHCEGTGSSSNTETVAVSGFIDQGRGKGGYSTLCKRQNTMSERDSWSCKPIGISASSNTKSIKEISTGAFDSARSSGQGFNSNSTYSKGNEFSMSESFLVENTPVDNLSFSYPLGDTTHTGKCLDFFENTDSTDFLYDGWPEIGNFEDVDRMFRNCDSTFGSGAGTDELGWLSYKGESGDVLKSDFMESNADADISENNDSSKSYSINDSTLTSAAIGLENSFCSSEKSKSYISFDNGLDIADARDGFIPKNQINNPIKHFHQLKHSEENRGHNFGNGGCSYLIPNKVIQLPSGSTSHEGFPSAQQQQQELGSDSFSCLQNNIYVHSDNSHLSDQTFVKQRLCPLKSDCTNLSSFSSIESSHASSQLQSMETSNNPQSRVNALARSGKIEKLDKCQRNVCSMNGHLENASLLEQAFTCDPGSVGKQVQLSGDKFENLIHAEEVNLIIPAELSSSTAKKRPRISSSFDDISLEAASFVQLQLVLEWLDLRTKLCMRDGLYRLARSAEQRHYHANLGGNFDYEKATGGCFVADETNKWTNFVNMETDTNPLDRSIAHLLFHRPSNLSAISAHDS